MTTHTRTTCQHCGASISTGNIERHESTCPENPVVHARIAEALPDPAHPGVARSKTAYEAARVFYGASSASVLVVHYGTWAKVCKHFGLRVTDTPGADDGVTCPFCGGQSRPNVYRDHVARCPKNPAMFATILAVLEDAGNPGCSVSQRTYKATGTKRGAPGFEALVAAFGTWAAACEHFGLAARERAAEAERRAIAEAEEDERITKAILAYEADRGGALPICRVRVIDGGRRVACEVR